MTNSHRVSTPRRLPMRDDLCRPRQVRCALPKHAGCRMPGFDATRLHGRGTLILNRRTDRDDGRACGKRPANRAHADRCQRPCAAGYDPLARHAVSIGAGGVCVQPFYYKPAEDIGLFDFFSRVIDGVGDDRLRL